MEIVPFSGWEKNARIVCGDMEMIVTLEVGPRVISFGYIGGPNLFAVHADSAGKTGGDKFIGYGGHRLWIAPEEELRTLRPDNDPVEYDIDEEGYHVFTSPPDVYHTQKQIRIFADEENECFILEHRIYNHTPYEIELGAWTPTQCRTGEVVFPQAPYASHDDVLLPTRPLVLWAYTKMTDKRWTWGDHVVRLKHDPEATTPQKIGTRISQGYAAAVIDGTVFLKRFPFEEEAYYPDFNCNFETFTRRDMLEIESLGPMEWIAPGAYTEHVETWYLVPNAEIPADDAECAAWLEELASTRPGA